LRRFPANPKLNIDNSPCENVIRPFCLGRKNWLFVGNGGVGVSMAVLASFAATCKDNGVDFEKWLADVLLRLDSRPASGIRTLLPHNWKPES
ncbi:MAG: transposase domain-containing protein, partial [Victivallales bacterium]|nr:transposase domain-containing protein [Victivallales bacterium]